MDGDAPPHQVLRDASLAMLARQIRPRKGTAFVVDWQGTPAVLRSVSPIGPEIPGAGIVDDVRWQHAFLSRLTALKFPQVIHCASGSMPMSGRLARTRLAIICCPQPNNGTATHPAPFI